MKHAVYSLITSNDYNKTIKKLQESYSILKMGALSGSMGASYLERRDNADLIAVMILKLIINSNQKPRWLEFFRSHFFTF